MNRQDRYSSIAVLLHWTIALAIVFQIILGWRMDDDHKSAATYLVFQLHKSIGITILLLSLARLGWRLSHPAPPMPAHLKTWEKHLAHTTHVLFYVIMIGLPITGWVMVSASKTNIPTLLFGAVPWPHIPGLAELPAEAKVLWHKIGEIGHGVLAKLTYLLLILHVLGALKHQLIDRDATLSRMLPGVPAGAWFDPKAMAAACAFLASIAGGYLVFSGPAPKPATLPASVAAPAPAPAPPPAATPDAAKPADAAPKPAAAAATPDIWLVDKGSSLGFSTVWSSVAINGAFPNWTADIAFSPDALEASHIKVEIDIASVSTGDAQRDATLPTDDWFNTGKFPKAVFTSSHIKKAGDHYVADGVLKLKGVAKPARLSFSVKIDGEKATASGQTSLDRTAFGVGQGEYGGTDQIPAAVAVSFQIKAHRKSAPH
jgi:cytochrome b561/polyisoprenoid-binding protein YceI